MLLTAFRLIGQNAAAIQAISALAVIILTVCLIGVTWQYVRLTRTIAETMARQLSASVQPIVSIEIQSNMLHEHDQGSATISAQIQISNVGEPALKVLSMIGFLNVIPPSAAQPPRTVLKSPENLLLLPKKQHIQTVFLDVGKPTIRDGEYCIGIGINCTDLAGVSQHFFYYDSEKGLRHWFGFEASNFRPNAPWTKTEEITRRLAGWSGGN